LATRNSASGISGISGLLRAGVDGWWNDEGESAYTTYYYWNLAEAEAWPDTSPVNVVDHQPRLFPGGAAAGRGAWTGDIRSSWKVLAETPTSLLNWSLAGMPYGACDIGGFLEILRRNCCPAGWRPGFFFRYARALGN